LVSARSACGAAVMMVADVALSPPAESGVVDETEAVLAIEVPAGSDASTDARISSVVESPAASAPITQLTVAPPPEAHRASPPARANPSGRVSATRTSVAFDGPLLVTVIGKRTVVPGTGSGGSAVLV